MLVKIVSTYTDSHLSTKLDIKTNEIWIVVLPVELLT
jgi:hypothetical protein